MRQYPFSAPQKQPVPNAASCTFSGNGGHTVDPTYDECCSGRTGHNESVLVAYDTSKVSYIDILKQFWECHDPTQGDGQGGDRGTQYRSGIYCYNQEQQRLAEASKEAYQKALVASGYSPITTEIVYDPKFVFYYAEDYHQQYLAKPGGRQYCSAQPSGIPLPEYSTWAPQDLKEKHTPLLNDQYWTKYGPKPGCTIKCPNEQIVL